MARVLRPPLPIAITAGVAAAYAWALFAATFRYPGAIGIDYNAPGTDWMVFYGAVRALLDHNLPMIFDGDKFTAYLNSTFVGWLSKPLPFRPWVYPPTLLLFVAPFGFLGFVASYLAFQLVSGGLLVAALRHAPDRPFTAPAVAAAAVLAPAAAINAINGQLSFLVAALIVAGFRLLKTRPLTAGAVLGLLTFKPQFCLLVPVALVALRQWKAVVVMIGSALALAALSALIFGIDPWISWANEVAPRYLNPGANADWIAYGRIWGDSVYACALLLGASSGLASGLQNLSIAIGAAATYAAFRSRLQPDERLAVLLTATILAAPHSLANDQVLLVIAGGFWLVADGSAQAFRSWLVALALWVAPLLDPPPLVVIARFKPLFIAAFIALALSRAYRPATLSADAPSTT
ncbi:MAG: glycosyltransferase family 87 protein [Xanthobacteraceae bacterium]